MITRFENLKLGASFWFHGKRYVKMALSMAEDEQRAGTIFQAEADVIEGDAPSV